MAFHLLRVRGKVRPPFLQRPATVPVYVFTRPAFLPRSRVRTAAGARLLVTAMAVLFRVHLPLRKV